MSNRKDKIIKMLLVEDDEDFSYALALRLARRGFEITAAASAEEALAKLKGQIFDVVVADIRLPGMDGMEFLAKIRECRDDMPVIMLTGYASLESAREAVRLKASDYLLKPLGHIDELLNPVSKAVYSYRLFLENKKLTDNLRASEEKYRGVVDNIGIGIYLLSPQMEVLALNNQMRRWFPEVDASKKPVCYRVFNKPPREDICPDCPSFETFQDGEVHEAAAKTLSGDKIVFYRIISSPVKDKDGKVTASIEMLEDITENIRAEEKLKEAKLFTETALNAIQDIFYVIDLEGKFLIWNKSLRDITGYSDVEISLMKPVDFFEKDDVSRVAHGIERTLAEGSAKIEANLITKDRRNIFFEFIGSTIKDSRGSVIGIAGSGRNLMEHNREKKALKESHRNLERKVEERTTALREMNLKLQETADELMLANKVKSEFLANMSHELRTPLNSVIGFSEVLFDEKTGPLNERQKEYLDYVLVSGKHLLSLINDVLDMAKVEAGKMELEISVLSLRSLLEECMILIKEMAFNKDIKMSLDISGDVDSIEADERKVKQIIFNLLSNAVKFTPPGGEIVVKGRKSAAEVEVTVWDTGIGIAPENLEKIFEAFHRIDTPYSRAIEGTGLGLALCKKLVELHGGKIQVESKGANKGTAVMVTMPVRSS